MKSKTSLKELTRERPIYFISVSRPKTKEKETNIYFQTSSSSSSLFRLTLKLPMTRYISYYVVTLNLNCF
ncbi:hypothetical protein RJT34_25786 [Clitoria ternatea]|uniref:Uncharacterized protein n=1 Tax=Clitoria ternatea TaxID=43366 RepID=A0AAN9IJ38_CLITE